MSTAKPKKRTSPMEIERQIHAIRDDLDGLVGELDRRRHEALDWRLQASRHRRPLLVAVGVVGVGIGGYATLRRRRRRRAFGVKVADLAHALRSVAENPAALTRVVDNRSAGSTLASASSMLARAVIPTVARSLLRRRESPPPMSSFSAVHK
jgi:hypothetical protein